MGKRGEEGQGGAGCHDVGGMVGGGGKGEDKRQKVEIKGQNQPLNFFFFLASAN